MKKIVALILTLILTFSLVGCNKKPSLPEKGDPITFNAEVLSIDEELESVFVEAEGQDFEKAVISLHSDTELVDSEGNTFKLSELEKGDSLTITNFGLIAEQFPVQMSAKKIVLNK